jgi:hypothetical protein
MDPEQNRRGCFIILGIIVAIIAVAFWLSTGTISLRDSPAANVAAPGDPTVG